MIPVSNDEDATVFKNQKIEHPFSRGIMAFDDYNYKSHNDYVLIEEPEESEKNRIIEDRKNLSKTSGL